MSKNIHFGCSRVDNCVRFVAGPLNSLIFDKILKRYIFHNQIKIFQLLNLAKT